jgi:hypothetical protein
MRTSPSLASNNSMSHQIPHLYNTVFCLLPTDNKGLTIHVTKTGVGMQQTTIRPLSLVSVIQVVSSDVLLSSSEQLLTSSVQRRKHGI